MAQKRKGERVLAQAFLPQPVLRRVMTMAAQFCGDKPMSGALLADGMAYWCEQPESVKDFQEDFGVLPISRDLYDVLRKHAADRGTEWGRMAEILVAEGVGRPDLLDRAASEQQQLLSIPRTSRRLADATGDTLVNVRLQLPVADCAKEIVAACFGPEAKKTRALVQDFAALLCGEPDYVKDFHGLGALPVSRAVYGAALAFGREHDMSLPDVTDLVVAHGVNRVDLLDKTIAKQEILPIGTTTAA